MSRQLSSARLAAGMGSLCLVLGMVYGTQVNACPHPQLALGAHVQFMNAGLIGCAAGAMLYSQSLCRLDGRGFLLFLTDLGHYTLFFPAAAEALAAWKGQGMPLVWCEEMRG